MGAPYHLTLVFWPWKLGIGLGAATLVVAMTATLVQNDGAISRRVLALVLMLVILMLAAGALSYDAHLNEPADDDRDDEPGSTTVKLHHARERSEPGAVSRDHTVALSAFDRCPQSCRDTGHTRVSMSPAVAPIAVPMPVSADDGSPYASATRSSPIIEAGPLAGRVVPSAA